MITERDVMANIDEIKQEIKGLHSSVNDLRGEIHSNKQDHVRMFAAQEEIKEDVKNLHVDFENLNKTTQDAMYSIKEHFVGISAPQHIKDHSAIEKLNESAKHNKGFITNIAGSVIAALLVGAMGWMITISTTTHEDAARLKMLDQIREEIRKSKQ